MNPTLITLGKRVGWGVAFLMPAALSATAVLNEVEQRETKYWQRFKKQDEELESVRKALYFRTERICELEKRTAADRAKLDAIEDHVTTLDKESVKWLIVAAGVFGLASGVAAWQ